MLNPKMLHTLAPGIGARIVQFHNDASIPPYIVVENTGDTLSAAIEYQESDNGTTWSTVVGTSASIPPKQSNGQIVNSNKRLLAIFAQGNTPIEISVVRNYNYDGQQNID